MTQIIDVPGQGPVEFPDEMPDEQIALAIKRTLLSPMQKRMGLGKQGDTMGDIRQAREHAAYELGGRVTDLTGSPLAGSFSNAAVEAATDPLTYAGGVFGKAVKPALESGGFKLMWQALKPDKFARTSGDAKAAVETLLKEGANVTEGGVQKLTSKIDVLDSELDSAISNAQGNVNVLSAVRPIKDAIARFKDGLDQASNKAAIWGEVRKFFTHPEVQGLLDIPTELAQRIKRAIYTEVGDKGYGFGVKPMAEREAKKTIARGLNEGISRVSPEAAAINAEMSPLINARDLAQDRVLTAMNKQALGIGILNPRTLLVHMADRSELMKSLLARLLYSGVAPAAPSLGASAGGGLGELLSQQGQQP